MENCHILVHFQPMYIQTKKQDSKDFAPDFFSIYKIEFLLHGCVLSHSAISFIKCKMNGSTTLSMARTMSGIFDLRVKERAHWCCLPALS